MGGVYGNLATNKIATKSTRTPTNNSEIIDTVLLFLQAYNLKVDSETNLSILIDVLWVELLVLLALQIHWGKGSVNVNFDI